MKVTITTRAFIARMKRSLAKEGLTLHAPRYNSRAYGDLGPFYTSNEQNVVESWKLDYGTLLGWARESGTLKQHETVEGLEDFEGERAA